MAQLKNMLHVRYRVEDLEKSVAFYRDVLGLKETRRLQLPHGKVVFLSAGVGGMEIKLCCFPASGPVQVPPDLTNVGFEVDDLEAFAQQLKLSGHPLSFGPAQGPNGGMYGFLDAPEGYKIELIQRASS